MWYEPPESNTEKLPNGTICMWKTCKKYYNITKNDSRLQSWIAVGVGLTRRDTKSESRCHRMAKAMRRILAHRRTHDFVRRLGHSLQKKPPKGTWGQYEYWRRHQVKNPLIPHNENLKTIATVFGLWRQKRKSGVEGETGTWAPKTDPGVISQMRVVNRGKKKKNEK